MRDLGRLPARNLATEEGRGLALEDLLKGDLALGVSLVGV